MCHHNPRHLTVQSFELCGIHKQMSRSHTKLAVIEDASCLLYYLPHKVLKTTQKSYCMTIKSIYKILWSDYNHRSFTNSVCWNLSKQYVGFNKISPNFVQYSTTHAFLTYLKDLHECHTRCHKLHSISSAAPKLVLSIFYSVQLIN